MKPYRLIWKYFLENTTEEKVGKVDMALKGDNAAKEVAREFLKANESEGNSWICYTLLSLKNLGAIAHKERFVL